MAGNVLYTVQVLREYPGPGSAAQLKADLQEQDRCTVMSVLDRPDQVLLTASGKTIAGELRLSSIAFRQLCRLLSPGLVGVVTDMAGLRRVSDESDRDRYSTSDAIHILNTLVQRRFRTCLDGMQTVRDTRSRTIEGIVGRAYRRLSNSELHERVNDILLSFRQPVEFHHASVIGRSFSLFYRGSQPVFEIKFSERNVDQFYTGFYYSNSEVGDRAIRAASAIVRGRDGARAIGLFRDAGSKMSHIGKQFDQRFVRLLNRVIERAQDLDYLRQRIQELANTPLGFVGNDDLDEIRFVALTNTLQARDLTRGLSQKIMRNVLAQGGFDRIPIDNLDYVSRGEWAHRTAYDLFSSISRIAKSQPLSGRERLEQFAHHLLTGKFSIDRGGKK